MFGLVVTHSCEIDRQPSAGLPPEHLDCRLTVAPIVPEAAVTLVGPAGMDARANWAATERNDPVASLYLPAIEDLAELAPEVRHLAWPRSFADLRGLSTVSRRMVAADRPCALTPAYLAVLQRRLARFFTWRDLACHEALERLVGKRVAAVTPLSEQADRWRVALTADDRESMTVEVRSRRRSSGRASGPPGERLHRPPQRLRIDRGEAVQLGLDGGQEHAQPMGLD